MHWKGTEQCWIVPATALRAGGTVLEGPAMEPLEAEGAEAVRSASKVWPWIKASYQQR
jgi:hypothetical protein